MQVQNFHHFSPATPTRVMLSVCFDDCWLLFISGHYNEINFLIFFYQSDQSYLYQRGNRSKCLIVNLYFKTYRIFETDFAFAVVLPICVCVCVCGREDLHVYCKVFMSLIKMNVFIYLLSTKTSGDQAWSCDVYGDEKLVCSLGCNGAESVWESCGFKLVEWRIQSTQYLVKKTSQLITKSSIFKIAQWQRVWRFKFRIFMYYFSSSGISNGCLESSVAGFDYEVILLIFCGAFSSFILHLYTL